MNFDHVLLIGYGGPRTSEEVLPFLKGRAEGRNISEEKLLASTRRYEAIGGASPYYKEVRRFAERLEKTLRASGLALPVYVGMKHWKPFLAETLLEIRQKGHQKGLAIMLNVFPGAAAGARYKESLQASKIPGLDYVFVEGGYDNNLFVDAQAAEVKKVLMTIPDEERASTPVVFTFHSLPEGAAQGYVEETKAGSALVADRLSHSAWSVAYQSKPLDAGGAWLGPDISEVIEQLAKVGQKRVVVVPLGFFCDHVEILYDLDIEAGRRARFHNIEYLRPRTVIHHPKITDLFLQWIKNAA